MAQKRHAEESCLLADVSTASKRKKTKVRILNLDFLIPNEGAGTAAYRGSYAQQDREWPRLDQFWSSIQRKRVEKESIYRCFYFCMFLVLQVRVTEDKNPLIGGLLRHLDECSGSVDDKEVQTRVSPSEVVMPERIEENGDDETLCESSHLAARMDSLSEPMEKEGKKASGLYRPVTREEMQTLKETENLFRSNLLKLQVLYPPVHMTSTW